MTKQTSAYLHLPAPRSLKAFALAFAFCLALPLFAQESAKRARVSGHVYDAAGNPLARAQVSVFPLETAFSGGLPGAITDSSGFYTFDTPAYGKTRILVIKEDAGYPNTMSAIFAPDVEALPEVSLAPGADLHDVDVHLGEPDGSIEGEIRDAVSNTPVTVARITMRRVSNPDVMFSTNSGRDATFRFVLPNRQISMTIAAPGYSPWTYIDALTGNNFLQLKSQDRKKIVVELQPLKK